jgi:hypothetical protein
MKGFIAIVAVLAGMAFTMAAFAQADLGTPYGVEASNGLTGRDNSLPSISNNGGVANVTGTTINPETGKLVIATTTTDFGDFGGIAELQAP